MWRKASSSTIAPLRSDSVAKRSPFGAHRRGLPVLEQDGYTSWRISQLLICRSTRVCTPAGAILDTTVQSEVGKRRSINPNNEPIVRLVLLQFQRQSTLKTMVRPRSCHVPIAPFVLATQRAMTVHIASTSLMPPGTNGPLSAFPQARPLCTNKDFFRTRSVSTFCKSFRNLSWSLSRDLSKGCTKIVQRLYKVAHLVGFP